MKRLALTTIVIAFVAAGCSRGVPRRAPRNLLLITIDTIRADRVGAYGYARARTPTLDALASAGALFERAYSAAPITLPSHATILTGRYPPGHGSRDNGIPVAPSVPTLATALKAHGFRTGAFVAAYPLDHQFGLARGFDVYSDRLPRDAQGRPANERPASTVVTEAIGWLQPAARVAPADPFFAWVHLFEPHAPYAGDLSRPVADRYDDEIATADHEIGRLLASLGSARGETLIVVAGDHGEAFGEHGEYAHSIFVYDVTLRVPLIVAGPGVAAGRMNGAVTLADVAPSIMRALGFELEEADGIALAPFRGGIDTQSSRELYAESFAPLVEFGWAPLRALRSAELKYIAAPKPELYDLRTDSAEVRNLADISTDDARRLAARVERFSTGQLRADSAAPSPAALERLRALGYVGSGSGGAAGPAAPGFSRKGDLEAQGSSRADPKDRRELAARLARVTSGELTGAALLDALEGIVRDDPQNGQAHLRLGYALLEKGDCARAEREFAATIAAGLRTADAYLGLATCQGRRRDLRGAESSLTEAQRLEPDNPVIRANLGILQASRGNLAEAAAALRAAIDADPDLLEARFNLVLVLARAGRRGEARAAAEALLARLPADAPQRGQLKPLIESLQNSK
jgi:choline-sulfatase